MDVEKEILEQNGYAKDLSRPFYSINQLADFFQVNRSTISRLLKDGELAYYLIRGAKRIAREDVVRFLDKQIANEVSQKSSSREDS